jgi:hypothetical protein
MRNLLGILTLIAICGLQGCYVSPEGRAKIKELQELASQTETFPGFEQVDYSDISNSEGTIVAYFYKSSAPYEQVKEFYTRTLSAKGWASGPEKPLSSWAVRTGTKLTFFKGQYRIDVEYTADSEEEYQYSVGYGWTRKT